MPWTYHQSTGRLSLDGSLIATGYSGKGDARNDGSREGERNIGPIPRGQYAIAAPRDSLNTGPYVMDLTPVGHDALGRDDFQIHGPGAANPDDSSRGCIILERGIREQIGTSGDMTLIVIP